MSRSCGSCGNETAVMMEMQPGANGEAWFLCSSCWSQPTQAPTMTMLGLRKTRRAAQTSLAGQLAAPSTRGANR